MIKEAELQASAACTGTTKKTGCQAFKKLKDWQVDQYRIAVDENKWYMGERLGRYVEWEEAEEDFLHNGYYGCAPKWRKEYCARKCTHFATCGLGREFCRTSKK
ncbi:hypothetical protein P4B35_12935 [Pontiellaceae bacterium B12227]|nr:hypothetical protein [Pontiellaceae bacterium B12227]